MDKYSEKPKKKTIAIIDDEIDILNLVSLHLKRANFETEEFENIKDFFKYIEYNIPELIILDLMLPDADGIEVCKTLKNNERYLSIPIIMLTAKAEESDIVLGLELGADDYIVKPFSPKELVARVKAVLRRNEKKDIYDIIQVGDILKIDVKKHKVFVYDKEVFLTNTEFKILQTMAKRKGWVYSRSQLLNILWGNEKLVIDRTIDVHIRHIREKLGKASKFIKNIKGVGYKIEE